MNQASLFDPEPEHDVVDASPGLAAVPPPSTGSRRLLVIEADGGSRGNPGPAGYGALVREGDRVLAERAEYLGVVSNNVAEYSGLIAGLTAARQIDPTALVEVRMDSKLVVEQMSGRWKIKHEDMQRLARHARDAFRAEQVTYSWIPRAENAAADALANQVMDSTGQIRRNHPADDDGDALERPFAVPDVDTDAPSMSQPDVVTVVLVSPGMTPRTAAEVAAVSELDAELTQDGIDLAAGAAGLVDLIGDELWPHLPAPAVLLSSPAVRAQQTAQLISESTGLGAPLVDKDFVRSAPGETAPHVARRVERAINRLVGRYRGQTVVVAAHADIIAAVAGIAAELPRSSWHALRIAPGTVSVVRCWDGGGEVHVLGCPAQLGDATG
ncbi:reverse transcriptase-like protein [Georgenia sunbinii]|uniref:reverse transcriptase-like protein n=1 Tax=Georgenia sunbinii TaxID=3117728 RepID=UPI002F262FFD